MDITALLAQAPATGPAPDATTGGRDFPATLARIANRQTAGEATAMPNGAAALAPLIAARHGGSAEAHVLRQAAAPEAGDASGDEAYGPAPDTDLPEAAPAPLPGQVATVPETELPAIPPEAPPAREPAVQTQAPPEPRIPAATAAAQAGGDAGAPQAPPDLPAAPVARPVSGASPAGSRPGPTLSMENQGPEPAGPGPALSAGPTGTGGQTTLSIGNSAAGQGLNAPVDSPAWKQELGQQLAGLARRGGQQLELRLNPPELGPLSINLKMDDQGAQAQFFSTHAPVRAAVEQAIPQLREALAEQGIVLDEAQVGDHPEDRRQATADGGPGGRNPAAPTPDGHAEDGPQATTTGDPGAAARPRPGGIDLYA